MREERRQPPVRGLAAIDRDRSARGVVGPSSTTIQRASSALRETTLKSPVELAIEKIEIGLRIRVERAPFAPQILRRERFRRVRRGIEPDIDNVRARAFAEHGLRRRCTHPRAPSARSACRGPVESSIRNVRPSASNASGCEDSASSNGMVEQAVPAPSARRAQTLRRCHPPATSRQAARGCSRSSTKVAKSRARPPCCVAQHACAAPVARSMRTTSGQARIALVERNHDAARIGSAHADDLRARASRRQRARRAAARVSTA